MFERAVTQDSVSFMTLSVGVTVGKYRTEIPSVEASLSFTSLFGIPNGGYMYV